MKIIHLSDLHLGKRVHEFSMLDDQRYILKQILEHVAEEHPDVVILAGDIYDKPVPPAEAVFMRACGAERGSHDHQWQSLFGRAYCIWREADGAQRCACVSGL